MQKRPEAMTPWSRNVSSPTETPGKSNYLLFSRESIDNVNEVRWKVGYRDDLACVQTII